MNFLLILFCLFFCGCSSITSSGSKVNHSFNLQDVSGEYKVFSEEGSKESRYYLKEIVYPKEKKKEDWVEKKTIVSFLRKIRSKKKEEIFQLYPSWAQNEVWIEGIKFFSQLKIDSKKKRVEEISYQGDKEKLSSFVQAFPDEKGVYCFFSQVMSCGKVIGFLEKAIEKNVGKFHLYLLMDGHPFINEQYSLPTELIFPAELIYLGSEKGERYRFSLQFSGETILYDLDEEMNLVKKVWVSQGLVQEKGR